MYHTPLLEVATKCVYSNTTLVSAYRGAGRPEGALSMERTMDYAAAELGIDRFELRKRNFIKAKEMPFATPAGTTYDSGDFPALFKEALEHADVKGFKQRKRESKRNGKLRGLGVGCFVETTAAQTTEMGGIRFNEDGTVTIITGTLDYGQGHATPFAQVLCAQLGVPFESVKLEQGDSDIVHNGNGTGGSRSITASGMAIVEASKLVIEKGKRAAAHLMEAAEGDIEFGNGRFTIAGTDRSIDIIELAKRLREGKMPEGVPSSLDVDHVTEPVPSTFPNGCHVAEVEIDPETGIVQIVRYTGVNDFGTIVNPLLVAGQLHGGVAQGIGQALMEEVSYDESGQPITGSFMDYALPRAEDIPSMEIGDHPVPAKSNPLGTKGCGEAGCAGSLSTLVNAVLDALEAAYPMLRGTIRGRSVSRCGSARSRPGWAGTACISRTCTSVRSFAVRGTAANCSTRSSRLRTNAPTGGSSGPSLTGTSPPTGSTRRTAVGGSMRGRRGASTARCLDQRP
jgi:carbon-monoxide dehydrogenase large subunit